MRILGLDYGDMTIGVAVSDQLQLIAYAIDIIFKKSLSDFALETNRLSHIINEYAVEKIVIGIPKNLDNSYGPQCKKTLAFKNRVKILSPILILSFGMNALALSPHIKICPMPVSILLNKKKLLTKWPLSLFCKVISIT